MLSIVFLFSSLGECVGGWMGENKRFSPLERRFKHLNISKRKKPELRCEPCKVSGQGKLCHRISKA